MPLFFDREKTLIGASGASASGTGAVKRRCPLTIGRTGRTGTVRRHYSLAIGKTERTRTVSGRCPLVIGRTGRTGTVSGRCPLAVERTNTCWFIEISKKLVSFCLC